MRKNRQVGLRLLASILRRNGIDPRKLKGANRLYGNANRVVRLRRIDIAKINTMLAEGRVVVLRPTQPGSLRAWEFVHHTENRTAIQHHGTPLTVNGRGPREDAELKVINPRAVKLGQTLVSIRRHLGEGFQQWRMAELIGVPLSQYARYERGENYPRHKQLAKIAHFVEGRAELGEFKEKILESAAR